VKKRNFSVIFVFGILVISAMTAMAIDHSRQTLMCQDERLYMDGVYAAKIQTGGLTPHTDLTFYKIKNLKNVLLSTQPVRLELSIVNGVRGDLYSNPNLKLFIPATNTDKKFKASLEATIENSVVKAKLICSRKS
jgi:hypothetical protein